jgi:hypothetical protein
MKKALLIIITTLFFVCAKTSDHEHIAFDYNPPFTIVEIDKYRDGGTTYAVLEDQNKKEMIVCFDRKIGSETHNRLYFGVRYPDLEGGELVAIGSALEKNILVALQESIDKNLQQQKDLLEKQSAIELAKDEVQIRWLLQTIDYYKKQHHINDY